MADFSALKAGQKITYKGDSFAFGGGYELRPIEDTYVDKDKCPSEHKGKPVIIEFMNDGTPMFFTLDMLNPNDWEVANDPTEEDVEMETCDTCDGSGFSVGSNGHPCSPCEGTGEIIVEGDDDNE